MLMSFSFGVPFLPFYIQDLGIVDEDQIKIYSAILTMVPAISMAVMAPLWGIVADKWGKKLMLLRAMFFAAFIIGAMGFVADVNQLIVLRFLQGVFTGTVTAATALVATGTPSSKLSYAIGFLSSSTFIGASAGPVIGGFLADISGYRFSFGMAGVLIFLDFLLVLILVKEDILIPQNLKAVKTGLTQDSKVDTSTEIKVDIQAEAKTDIIVDIQADLSSNKEKSKIASMKTFFTSLIITLLFVIFILRLVRSVFSPYLPLFIQEQVGAEGSATKATGIINGVTGLMTAVAGLTLSRLGDRYDKFLVLRVLFIAGLILSIPLVFSNNLVLFTISYGAFFFMLGGIEPIAVSMTSEITPPERRGFLFGVQGLVGNLAWVVAPVLGGLISIQYSNHAVLYLIPVFLLPGFASVLYFQYVHRQKQQAGI